MQVIIYEYNGVVGVFTPSKEALDLLTLKEIGERCIAKDVPFWIVSSEDLPEEYAFQTAWELDKATLPEPDGYGNSQ